MQSIHDAEMRYRLAEAAVRFVRAHIAALELREESRHILAHARQHGQPLPILDKERRATSELGSARRALDLARAGMVPVDLTLLPDAAA